MKNNVCIHFLKMIRFISNDCKNHQVRPQFEKHLFRCTWKPLKELSVINHCFVSTASIFSNYPQTFPGTNWCQSALVLANLQRPLSFGSTSQLWISWRPMQRFVSFGLFNIAVSAFGNGVSWTNLNSVNNAALNDTNISSWQREEICEKAKLL